MRWFRKLFSGERETPVRVVLINHEGDECVREVQHDYGRPYANVYENLKGTECYLLDDGQLGKKPAYMTGWKPYDPNKPKSWPRFNGEPIASTHNGDGE